MTSLTIDSSESIEEYLLKTKFFVYLINKIIINNKHSAKAVQWPVSQMTKLTHFLLANKVRHVFFLEIGFFELIKLLSSSPYFYSQNLLLVFDFSKLNFNQINELLNSLIKIHFHCLKCLPLIVLINDKVQHNLVHLKRNLFGSDFQAVFVANKLPKVYVNPIVNGCIKYKGILIPHNKAHLEMLKTSFAKCNLNDTLLNVSVNHVGCFLLNLLTSKFFSLQWIPFCDLNRLIKSHLKLKPSMEPEILNVLQKRYNFRAKLIDAHNIWGLANENGSWNGLVGDVLYKVNRL